MSAWYEDDGTPEQGTWWWAVEHLGHPAFYLRALLPGDFALGRYPAQRHAATLAGDASAWPWPRCGTCGEVPPAYDLDPVERATGDRGFLTPFREGQVKWPAATDPNSCWGCSGPPRLTTRDIGGRRFCEACAAHMGA